MEEGKEWKAEEGGHASSSILIPACVSALYQSSRKFCSVPYAGEKLSLKEDKHSEESNGPPRLSLANFR